jgi:hypothetical protein
MHPCLSVHEILIHAFQYATTPDVPAPGSDEFYSNWLFNLRPPTNPLSLALTCRTFLEPGLDLVWYEILSLDPFKHSGLPRDKPISAFGNDKPEEVHSLQTVSSD